MQLIFFVRVLYMFEIENQKEKRRLIIIKFLQWEDRNGSYTDESRDVEGMERMSYEDAIKYFFGVINSDFYYSIVDNIFELTYEEIIEYSRKNNFYDNTMSKLRILCQEKNHTIEFYKKLLK